jgi:hypothetical protein
MTHAASMLRVLERREQKLRLDIARVARDVAAMRDDITTLEATLAAVDRRARENAGARFANGSRSVAALLELEQNAQSLRTGRQALEALWHRTEQALAKLSERQRTLSQRWRREESRLAHVRRLMRRERLLTDARRLDADDEAYAERRAASVHFGVA